MAIPKIVKYFTPIGRTKAQELVQDINAGGGQARIDMTWEDYGAGIMTETVLTYSTSLKLWCQALSPADILAMNEGYTPRSYSKTVAMATV